ncbi:hypothetical protein [Neptuniibacter sp. QD37_11]|uniref:hypothetical protein n=1 Tax=Neptuniibacter sp. QD37_11 TaxID=3398209 RepID=UPI0039F4EC12
MALRKSLVALLSLTVVALTGCSNDNELTESQQIANDNHIEAVAELRKWHTNSLKTILANLTTKGFEAEYVPEPTLTPMIRVSQSQLRLKAHILLDLQSQLVDQVGTLRGNAEIIKKDFDNTLKILLKTKTNACHNSVESICSDRREEDLAHYDRWRSAFLQSPQWQQIDQDITALTGDIQAIQEAIIKRDMTQSQLAKMKKAKADRKG